MEDLKIQLDFRHKIPLSDQVQAQLRGLIQSGTIQSGDQLPTVRQLAAQLRINFNTVARAYRVLDEEGWISTQQGRGTYVLDEAERVSLKSPEAESLNTGTEPQNEITSPGPVDTIQASASTADAEIVDLMETVDSSLDQGPELSAITPGPLEPTVSEEEPSSSSAEVSPTAGTTGTVKEILIKQWIERLLSETAQQGITLEDLYQGIIQKLASTQASEEVLSMKKLQRRTIKQSIKPGHQNYIPLERPDSEIHRLNKKRLQHLRR